MMEMDTNPLPGPEYTADADDLITYDENDGIEWIQDPNASSVNSHASGDHEQGPVVAPPAEADVSIVDIEISEEVRGDGDLDAEGSDVKMLSAGPSVAEEDRSAPQEVDDIDWNANSEDVYEAVDVESFHGEEEPDEPVITASTSGDVILLDEDILYDEEDYETDPVSHNEEVQIADHAANANGAGVQDGRTHAMGTEDANHHELLEEDVDAEGSLVSGEQAEEHVEITYEEEDENEEGEEEEGDDADGSVEEFGHETHQVIAGAEHPDDAADDGGSNHQYGPGSGTDLADNAGDNPIFLKEVTIVIDDGEEDDVDDGESVSSEIPMVTVRYKGDEFPLFRGDRNSNGRMPFFSTTATLESTMDVLLASFRQELSDELGVCDEIVFQVEELGLEYSESTSRDTLIGVTLKQLLEIFHLLVKNQDPDANQRLYTNLFTRPSTLKRLEALIEDAFAGKGLNEVSYKFRSHGPDDHQHRYLEAYESYEESHEAVDTEEADYGELHNVEAEIVDDDEPSNQSTSAHSTGLTNDRAGLGAMFDNQSAHGLSGATGTRKVEASMTAAADDEEEYEEGDEVERELDAVSALDAYANDKAYDDDIEHENDDLDQQDQHHDDPLHDELDLIRHDIVGDESNKETNTSGTATLNGEDEIDFGQESGDVVDMPSENAPLAIDLEGEEEAEDEIDWHEPAEPAEQLPSAKRPREEGDSAEDQVEENDFKRRRS